MPSSFSIPVRIWLRSEPLTAPVITETFLGGAITFGSCVAGLCVNAGMGFVVLLRNARQWKRNLLLVFVCYAASLLIGLALNLFPLYAI